MRTFVIAGTREEFNDWKRRTMPGASKYDVRYMTSIRSTLGMIIHRDDTLMTIGTYWRRPDLQEILEGIEINVRKSHDPSPQIRQLVRTLLHREAL